MTNQTTLTPLNPSTPTTEEEYVYTPFPPAFISDEPMEISGRDMAYLIPWMKAQLTAQAKHDDNSDLCEALTSILRQAHEVYGTESHTHEQCICFG